MRRVLAVAIAAAAAIGCLTTGAAATQSSPEGSIGLASQTPWVGAGEPFQLRLDVDQVNRPDQLDIVVSIHRAVTSRSQFDQTINDRLLGPLAAPPTVTSLAAAGFDAGGAVPIPITLPDLRDGVYPVVVALRDHDSDEEIDHFVTHLVRVPDQPVGQPLRVAWLQPVDAGVTLGPDGVRSLSEAQLRRVGRTAAAMADAAPMPITLDVSPDTVDGLFASRRTDILGELAQGLDHRQLLAAPYVDVDASALVAGGLAGELHDLRRTGETVLRATFGATDSTTWSSEEPLTARALTELRRLGVRRVVVPEKGLSTLRASVTGRRTVSRPFLIEDSRGQAVDAVVADAGLAAHFPGRSGQVLAAHHLLADLAVLYLDSPGTSRGVVVRPPSTWDPTPVFLSTVLTALDRSPVLRPVTVSNLVREVPLLGSSRSPAVRSATSTAPRLPSALGRTRRQLLGLRSLTAGDDRPLQPLRQLLFAAEDDGVSRTRRAAYLAAAEQSVRLVKERVHLVRGRTIRLTARQGTIPLTVVNDNPFTVHVSVELSSEKLEFADAPGTDRSRRRFDDVVLGPNQSSVLAVAVRARTSAAFALRAVLRAPDGSLELGRSRFTVIATAVSGLGIVLSVGAGLVLLLWWARHWRSTRRSRRLIPEPLDHGEAV